LRYSIIPSLEKAMPSEDEDNASITLLHEAVTSLEHERKERWKEREDRTECSIVGLSDESESKTK
jgi:hypothetical protein